VKHHWAALPLVVLAASLLGLAACGSARGDSPGTRSLNISVLSQTLYGSSGDRLIKVRQGESVTLHITVDEPMEIFLHSYDAEVSLAPGTPGVLEFTASTPGRFPLMIHSLEDEAGNHKRAEVLLALVEVSPRK